jgi:hypothetical protein
MIARMDSQSQKMEAAVEFFEEKLKKWTSRIWKLMKKSLRH